MRCIAVKRILPLLFAVLMMTTAVSAQEDIDGNELPDMSADDGGLLEMMQEGEEAVDEELQKSFVIIDSEHSYNMNPHTAAYNSEAQLLSSLYEGLFSYDNATLEPLPALAERYRVSRNRLRWTFTLREAQFSDGTPITANDVKESWLSLITDKGAMYASLLDVIKGAKDYRMGAGKREDVGISTNGEHTLVLSLVTPAGYLPRVLCHSAFVVCNKPGVYSGAFALEGNAADDAKGMADKGADENGKVQGTLRLVRNDKYWDAKNVKLERITIKQCSDGAANSAAFNSGEAQWVQGAVDASKIYNKNAVQLNAQFATEYLFFKRRGGLIGNKDAGGGDALNEESVWNNADMRAALLAAVPWEKLREKCFVKASTLVYPLAGYPAVDGYTDSDIEEAKALLAEAKTAHGITAEKLTLIFAITDTEYMKGVAQILIDAWEALGVEVLVQKTPPERYLEAIPAWKADLFTYTWIGDFADPLAFLELFEGGSTLNASRWQDDAFDAYIKDAARYSDEERTKLLAKAEQVLMDSAVVIPISHPVSLNVINLREVGGWRANAFDIHSFKTLYRKKTKPKLPNLVMLRQPLHSAAKHEAHSK